jgi:hypothetical protein
MYSLLLQTKTEYLWEPVVLGIFKPKLFFLKLMQSYNQTTAYYMNGDSSYRRNFDLDKKNEPLP